MARTVAEIDGDSSGLVGALDKGKAGMEKMEAEGKKLSDQLREVTDGVDKAAGAIVNKIGGPKAIAALAGAGAAIGGAKMAADFFLNSVEKLFKSMGDEGMKVWNDVEKALDSISGAFAKAVLGGGSAEDMGKKLITVFQGLAKIVEVIVTYGFPMLRIAFEALYWVMEKLGQVTEGDTEKFEALKRAQDNYASTSSVTNVENLTKAYGALSEKIKGLVGDQAALALSANDEAIAQLRAQQATFKKVGDVIRDVEIRKQVEKSRDVMMRQVEAEVANIDFSYAGMGWKIEREREIAERFQTKQSELYSSTAKQFAEAGRDAYSFMPEQLKLNFDAAAADLSLLDERGKKLFDQYLGKGEGKPKTGGGGGGKPPKGPAPLDPAIAAASAKLNDVMAKTQEKMDEMQRKAADIGTSVVSALFPSTDLVEGWKETGTALGEVWGQIKGVFTRTKQEMTTATKQGLTEEQEAQRANYDQFVNQNAKMVAISLAGGAKMADVARQALGNIVSALGDKAMTQAGIEFATGNVGMAAALTAAGAAAYATAAYLGANDKKSASATKATAAPAAPVTNNQTNFNLRVDAAFADEESIARSFARAQRLASNRYMGAS